MAKNTSRSNGEGENMPERTDSINVGPDRGGNVIAAWQGLFHLLGGRFDKVDVLPGEGIVVNGLSFDGSLGVSPDTVVDDISGRTRRVDLVDAWDTVVNGNEPPAFTNPLDMTKWMAQFFRKPGEDGKSPEYVKKGIANYKREHDFPRRKGRPKKQIRIEALGSLDPALLEGIDVTELEKLSATIAAAISARGTAEASA